MSGNGKKRCRTLALIQLLVSYIDWLSYPIFYLWQQPWKRTRSQVKAKLEQPDDPYSAYVRATPAPTTSHYLLRARTIPDCLRLALQNLPADTVSLGYRPVLDTVPQPDKPGCFRYELADAYRWLSLAEADAQIEALSGGLLAHGVQFQEPVLVFAETRIEWLLCAQALLRIGAIVVTLYPSLGRQGIVHGINETGVRRIITTGDLLTQIGRFIGQTPTVQQVVVIGPSGTEYAADHLPESVQLTAYHQLLEENGKAVGSGGTVEPCPEHTAIILYTSGSTGDPKGVVLTHGNVTSAMQAGFLALAPTLTEQGSQHTYYAILPLAHSYELTVELILFSSGLRIGYGSRHTMLDASPGLAPGCRGDMAVLRPTVMAAVPLLLNRLRRALAERFSGSSPFRNQLLAYLVQYRNHWLERGFDTPLLRRLLCQPFRAALGGRLQYVICGGAPLSPDTHRMLRALLDIHIMVGYGSTETCAASCMMDFEDLEVGHVGYPLHGLWMRLEDWPEAGYTVNDRPRPRGELLIGGPTVARSYFRLPEATRATFERSPDGQWWVRTGDVAEVTETGAFRIVDRKKDLIKLQFGEYVALGRVEAELKACPLVDEVCLHGDPLHTILVALVQPNRPALDRLAHQLLDKDRPVDWPTRCADRQLEARVLAELRALCTAAGLLERETPQRIKLCPEEWTVEAGHLTPTMKINRRRLYQIYARDLQLLYLN